MILLLLLLLLLLVMVLVVVLVLPQYTDGSKIVIFVLFCRFAFRPEIETENHSSLKLFCLLFLNWLDATMHGTLKLNPRYTTTILFFDDDAAVKLSPCCCCCSLEEAKSVDGG
jgi:hypothetical protein